MYGTKFFKLTTVSPSAEVALGAMAGAKAAAEPRRRERIASFMVIFVS